MLTSHINAQENNYEKITRTTQNGVKYGIKNIKTNKDNIPAIYDEIKQYREGYFISKKDNYYGLIDTINNITIPFRYKEILFLEKDRFLLSNPIFYLADSNGKKIGDITFDDVYSYNSNTIQFLKNGKIGYLNINGKIILEPKFEKGDTAIKDFIVTYSKKWNSFGYDVVTLDLFGNEINRQNIGTMGNYPILFNTKGKLLYKGENNESINFYNQSDLAIASRYIGDNKTRYIFIDINGKTKAFFDDIYGLHFSEVFIKIEKIDNHYRKFGLMNYKGEVIFKPIFKEITSYMFNNNQYAKLVLNDEDFFFIDKNMNCVNFENKNCPDNN